MRDIISNMNNPAVLPAVRTVASPSTLRFYWVWPTLITGVLSALFMGQPGLWSDELATWGAVRLDWAELFRLTSRVDAVLLPYFALEKCWTLLAGTSDVALRLPSVLAMTVAAGLLTVLGARITDRWVAVLGGLVFAFVPSIARYGQEARPYAFVVLFAVLATLLLVRWLAEPGVRNGLFYALAIMLLGAAHLVALSLLFAHAVAARQRLKAWAAWAAAGLIPLLPLVVRGLAQRQQTAWIAPARLSVLLSPETIFVGGVAGGMIITLGLLAMSRLQPGALLAAAWALVPTATLVLVAQFIPLFLGRYLLFTVPAWALLAGLTLSRISLGRAVAVLVAIGVLGGPAHTAFRWSSGHGQATRKAGAIIADGYQAGDGIAFSMLEYTSWVARDVVSRYVPAARRPRDVFEVRPQRTDGNLAAIECADLAACLEGNSPPRMWILLLREQFDPLHGLGSAKEELLRSRYHLSRVWPLQGLTVALYERS